MGRYCLCSNIRPVFKLAQYSGILPLTENHSNDPEKAVGRSCNLTYRWKSAPAILNSILSLLFLIPLPFVYSHVRHKFSNVFKGTDLFAFTFQVTAMVIESTVLILSGRLFKNSFAKGWCSLNKVYLSMVSVSVVVIEAFGFYIFNIWIQGSTSEGSEGLYENAVDLIMGVLVLTLTTIIPNVLTIFFLFICIIIRYHFLKITDMLKLILTKPNDKLPGKIDALRVLHEQLCQAVNHFEDFFGVQVLLILCVCCFTGTIGAYAFILQGEGMSSQKDDQIIGAWGIHLYSAAFFILVILISGQMVTNSALTPAPVLNEISLMDYDLKSQARIQTFLHKISAFPTHIRALKIASISASFLASAATNMITYLLVLMQFKLSLEKVDNCSPNISKESSSTSINTNNFTDISQVNFTTVYNISD